MTEETPNELRQQLEELRSSRARVVAAADAERRQLERELHDGVQQHLVALAVNIQLARQRADSDPADAAELLEEMARDVREALESARNIAQRIYPPLLVDRGLAEALTSAASAAAVETLVDVAGLERYPDDVEAAIYFCCVDALADAVKPGNDRVHATVRVWEELDLLRFEVTVDEGSDRPAAAHRPPPSISDRVGALGGRLELFSSPERRHLVGTIPLSR